MNQKQSSIDSTVRDFLAGIFRDRSRTRSNLPSFAPDYAPKRLDIHLDGAIAFTAESDAITYERLLPEGYTPLSIELFYDGECVLTIHDGAVVFSRIALT